MSNAPSPPPLPKGMKKFPANAQVLAEELKPTLIRIEQGRQKALQRIKKGRLLVLLGVLAISGVSLLMFSILSSSSSGAKHNFAPQFLVIPLILFFVYYYIIHLKFIAGHHNKYRNIYKNEIIGGMAKLLHSEIDYHPQRGISVSTFKESGLYSNRIDKYQCEDLFSGKIGKTQLLFSEVHAKEK